MQAIILAGGFGTRLKSVLGDEIPKPMAPIAGEPFLAHYLRYLKKQGVTKALLSLHHLPHTIQNYFGDAFEGIQLQYAVEKEPLGTGGAIAYGLSLLRPAEPIFVSNGDSFIELDIKAMRRAHMESQTTLTIALRKMTDCSRYGQAFVDDENRITRFQYPGNAEPGYISLGCYIVSPDIFKHYGLQKNFSFEADFQRPYCNQIRPLGFIAQGYFIDIGIPDDYERAKQELLGHI